MSYSELIKDIFGKERECIPEDEFLKILPSIMKKFRPKTAEKRVQVIICRSGLGGRAKQKQKDIAADIGVSPGAVRGYYYSSLGRLRMSAADYVIKPSDYEITIAKKIKSKSWTDNLSAQARADLREMRIELKEECFELFSRPPKMKNRGVLYPTITSEEAQSIDANILRMTLKVFNEIRVALGIEPFEKPAKKPSATEIAKAIKILNSAGYSVEKI